jgi:hypothetical protein
VQGQGLLSMLGRLWQSREQLDPGGKMANGFQMGRAIAGLVARLVPVDNRLLGTACRGVVLGEQLRLGFHERGEPGFEDPGNLLVDLLPGAFEQ